jgi:4'-phosphopantetheinyl transferase
MWSLAPVNVTLADHEVHVWRASLDQPAATMTAAEQTLSEDERQRASRFVFHQDWRRFVVGRGTLRRILSLYARVRPQEFCFRYGSRGKPDLDSTGDLASLQFNVSHSHELAIYAVARRRQVGVDLEWSGRRLTDVGQIAERTFSEVENATLRSQPPEHRVEAFLNCWTRKEAYLKARGDGLALPLGEFDVSLAPGAPAVLLGNRRDPAEVERWSIMALDPGPGYVAALAAEGSDWQLCCWEWPSESA